MSSFVAWAGTSAQSLLSAQPVSLKWTREAIRYVASRGNAAFRSEIVAHLSRLEAPPSTQKGVFSTLANCGFARVSESSRKVVLEDWTCHLIGNSAQKAENLCGLAIGVLNGGYSRSKKETYGEIVPGTRRLLAAIRRISREEPSSRITLERVCEELNERGTVSAYCLLENLGLPSDSEAHGDPWALGIVSQRGGRDKASYQVNLNEDVLTAYQVSIVSLYFTEIIPEIFQEKWGANVPDALSNKLDIVPAATIKAKLLRRPPVWLNNDDLDSVMLEVAKQLGYEWWGSDARGGTEGLLGNQRFAFMRMTREPKAIQLKNRFHGLF